MVDVVDDIEGQNSTFIVILQNNGTDYSGFTQKMSEEWEIFIANSMDRLEALEYHESYYGYVSSCSTMLEETEVLFGVLSSSVSGDLEKWEKVSDQLIAINECMILARSELVSAFEDNGINYTVEDDGIVFQYKVK